MPPSIGAKSQRVNLANMLKLLITLNTSTLAQAVLSASQREAHYRHR
jgi:hypothetical protein